MKLKILIITACLLISVNYLLAQSITHEEKEFSINYLKNSHKNLKRITESLSENLLTY